jgi:hypothetical protein
VFYIASGFYCIGEKDFGVLNFAQLHFFQFLGCIFWWFFCTGEVQPWAVTEKQDSKKTLDQTDEVVEIKEDSK